MNLMVSLAFISIALSGCSASVSVLQFADPISGSCSVQVYTSVDRAEKKGAIEELCIISGTSSGSFRHTVGTAIEKHKHRACECGANKVYIQAQDAGTLGTASVTLVAFRYTGMAESEKEEKEGVKPKDEDDIGRARRRPTPN